MLLSELPITRRKSTPVQVGHITIGGGAPIVVQSMTNTDTADVIATTKQVAELAAAGSEIVRITVDRKESAQAVPRIREMLDKQGCHVPLVGDFHYIGHTLLSEFHDCAKTLDKYRINPGNVGFGKKHDAQFAQMIEVALKHDKPVRIGVNWGSLDQALLARLLDDNAKLAKPLALGEVTRNALIESALSSANYAQACGMAKNKIIIAIKVSGVQDLVSLYLELASRCDYALHLGLTEAGMGARGIVATTAALAILLQQGIGDTIRASLTPQAGGDRTQEVVVCQNILQTMGLRSFMAQVSSCPGCGRTTSTYFQALAQDIQDYIRTQMPNWRQTYAGVENLKVAVMGCIVNGPGESKHADIGISLPGTGEKPVAPVFINGKKFTTLRGNTIAQSFKAILDQYIRETYSASDMSALPDNATEHESV